MLSRAALSIGRRGACLLIFSVVFCIYGVMLLIQDANTDAPSRTTAVIRTIAPFRVWGWVWIGVAGMSAVQAFGRLRAGRTAFAALTFISGVWAAGHISGWVVMEPPRDPRGWLLGVLWIAVFSLTLVLSGWKEDPRQFRRDDDDLGVNDGEKVV